MLFNDITMQDSRFSQMAQREIDKGVEKDETSPEEFETKTLLFFCLSIVLTFCNNIPVIML